MTRARLLTVVALVASFGVSIAHAEGMRVNSENGLAISGYDAVVFFSENRARKGSPRHALMWRGATWHFVSDETMDLFEMNPKAYAPQYGGYCARAMAEGRLAAPVPEAFAIINGKLYLTDSLAARDSWAGEAAAQIEKANAHWRAFIGQ